MQKKFLVSYEFLPYSNGGLARHATEMITRILLLKKSYKAIIAAPSDIRIISNKNFHVIPCLLYKNKYLGYIEFAIKLCLRYRKEFKSNKVIFFSSFSYLFNPFLPKKFYLFITNTTKRVFITDYPEETLFERSIRKITYFFLFHWENYMSIKAIKIFAISDSTKNDIINQYKINKNKIKIISCALNKTIFKQSRQKTIFNKELLFVGRLVQRKNIIDLIKIMKLLVNTDKGFILNIVGEGENVYAAKIKKEVFRNNLQQNIIFHGKVSDDGLNKLYKSNSIFVFTSLVEGFGLVLLEAMSKGLPVVAYDIVGVKDVVINKKNGFLIKPFYYQEFANKILSLYSNRDSYQKMSRIALKRVNYFSWDTSVKILNESLKKIDDL